MDIQKEVTPYNEFDFEYNNTYALPSKVRVSLYKLDQEPMNTIVIATELEDNPGPSITNSFEAFANSFLEESGLESYNCYWLESYRWAGEPVTYDNVRPTSYGRDVEITGVEWERLNDLQIEQIVKVIKNGGIHGLITSEAEA